MNYSVFEVFRIGVGPSSSHTVGPMSAVASFLGELRQKDMLARTERVITTLYGSLALTGVGHATDFAVIAGLLGETPEEVDPATSALRVALAKKEKRLKLAGTRDIAFDPSDRSHLAQRSVSARASKWHVCSRPLTLLARSLHQNVYFSIGGGAVLTRGRDHRQAPQRQRRVGPSSGQASIR